MFCVRVHSLHDFGLYGVAHVPKRLNVFVPLKFAGHTSLRVSVLGVQVGGFHTHVSLVNVHAPMTGCPYGFGQVF